MIIYIGDFKIDYILVDNLFIDLYCLVYYGEKGVMFFLSDFINFYKFGIILSESIIVLVFDIFFKEV